MNRYIRIRDESGIDRILDPCKYMKVERFSTMTVYNSFEQGLIASGCYFQPECGCYVKQVGDYTHSYLQDPDSVGDTNTWNYEKYYYNKQNDYDEIVESKRFTV